MLSREKSGMAWAPGDFVKNMLLGEKRQGITKIIAG